MRFAPVEHADVARLFRLKLEQYIAGRHRRRPRSAPRRSTAVI
jgi:hypothetical protein